MKKIIVLVILVAFFFSCNDSKKDNLSAFEKQMEANKHPGKKLMETNCYTCHSPSATQEDRIGPPMIAIKKHYIDSDTSKEDFVKSMQAWIKNPNAEDAKMFGAVKRFGVMPKQLFPEQTIAEIADYMFDFKIDQPEWFEDHFNEEKGNHKGQGMGKGKGQGKHKQQAEVNFEDLPDAERGLKYALTTKAVLGKNLMGTIQKKGTLEALAFCNEKAYPLTDSMAVLHNATIKRVSDKPRNQNNQANDKELEYITAFKNDIKNNTEPKPIVNQLDNKVQVYYPITTNTMCLQCHGKPNEAIQKPTLDKLANLYPKDKAIGYDVNQVRGIWSITYDK
ncbi:DUF3365 domain-containing protein [Olleya sp. R77988]|uniref:c-type heme family protein n=1 Tax=Olleya sp. R77988 TaxID=3093875 RepID=UPI0037C988F2